jgi:hypothetical protein
MLKHVGSLPRSVTSSNFSILCRQAPRDQRFRRALKRSVQALHLALTHCTPSAKCFLAGHDGECLKRWQAETLATKKAALAADVAAIAAAEDGQAVLDRHEAELASRLEAVSEPSTAHTPTLSRAARPVCLFGRWFVVFACLAGALSRLLIDRVDGACRISPSTVVWFA